MNELLKEFGRTYASFFDWHMWMTLFTDPVAWGQIFTLVVLEGLLSADNALVLAIIVSTLPLLLRKKALLYGLVGAYLFRFIFIGLGTTLAKFSFIKLLGAAYLIWIVVKFVKEKWFSKDENENGIPDDKEKPASGWMVKVFGLFWATVISVELVDISFSADSILAAIAISDHVGILLLGGMLGILMMRLVAGLFIKLLEKVPEMEVTAYFLIFFIGSKMALGVLLPEFHISHTIFFSFIVGSFLVTFIVHYLRKGKTAE